MPKSKDEPFTIEHFLGWVDQNELTLDNGDDWDVEPFQLAIVADIFEGFERVWAIIPEGNAKTTLFGGIALYHADHTPSPWVPIGAASRDQAEILFSRAAGFVDRSAELQKRFKVLEGYRKIRCATGGVGIKVYAADANTGDGVIPSLALVDEPHRHKNMRLYRLWKGKLKKRHGQIATMSTAGEPHSEFEDMREAIRAMATERHYEDCHLRAVGPGIAYHEWQVPKVEQANDLDMVKLANPLASITLQDLKDKRESPELDFGEDWLRLTCNIPTRSSFAAIPERDWDAAATEEEIPAGVPVAVGADFGFLEDTTAIVPLWIKSSKFRLWGDPYILEPPHNEMLDVEDIKEAFRDLNERNPIALVVMDRARAEDIAQWLSRDMGLIVIPREQTNEWAAKDYEAVMKALREQTVFHTGDKTFRLHAMSAISARILGDKRRFDRPRTQRKRTDGRHIVIDALTAAAMVLAVTDENPESIYKTRGAATVDLAAA